MTKAKISEYDAVAANNTDVNGVNISEGCPPSSMNNMGREIMAALKRFQTGADGDSLTVGGSLVVSNTLTAGPVSATTLNTSGAVVFNDAGADVDFRVESDTNANAFFLDGATGNIGIGVTPSAWTTLRVIQNQRSAFSSYSDGSPNASTQITTNAFYDGAWKYIANLGASFYEQTSQSGGTHIWSTAASGTAGNAITFTERARITSDGYFWTGGYTGTYDSPFGASYLVAQTTSTSVNALGVIASNASFASNASAVGCVRSASSSYYVWSALSGDGSTTPASDYEFRLRGDGNGYADGTWNNNGADYAEFFESANGQALTLGATVVLDGNKVREATEQDPASAVIGVVRPKEPSKASMVVGNTAWNKWANKYLTDDFDRYIMEDHDVVEWEETITDEEGKASTKSHSYESHNIPEGITVPEDATVKTHDEKGNKFQHYKLNPEWNPDSEYVNRENRAEWNIIGLLGQVKILKGQPVGDRWIKMRDISETVEEWFIR